MSFETPLPPYNASDPYATFLNASCLDFLLIEIVPMAHRTALASSTTAQHGEKAADEEEQRDTAYIRLESLGYRVGQGLVERYGPHLRDCLLRRPGQRGGRGRTYVPSSPRSSIGQ